MTEFILRTNGALNPRAISTGAAGWTTTRGFGGGAGAHAWVTAANPAAPPGVATARRKQWTTASTTAANAGFWVIADAANYFPVTGGEQVTVSGYIRLIGAGAAPKTFVARVAFYNQVPVSGATSIGATLTGTAVPSGASGTWQRVTHTFTVPAGAAGMAVVLDTANVGDAGFGVNDGLDATCLLIERSPVMMDWFDGALSGYRWAGDANNSVSQQVSATLPLPDGGSPARDAALHIRALAVAIDTALTSPIAVVTFDTGEVQANAAGVITGAAVGLASVVGAVAGPVRLQANSGNVGAGTAPDWNYAPLPIRNPNTAGNTISFRCVNPATGGVNANRFQRVVGIAWGLPVGARLDGSAMAAVLPPGTRFARGTTPRGLRYPGTDEPQWRTAAAIEDLAEDLAVALGGIPADLAVHTWRGTVTTEEGGTSTFLQVPFTGRLSRVRGAVATVWDGTSTPRGTWLEWWGTWDGAPQLWPVARFRAAAAAPAPGWDWAAGVTGEVSLNVVAWGDPA